MAKLNFRKKKRPETEEKITWQQRIMLDLHDLLYVFAVFMIIYMLFFRVVVVVGESMNNTLVDGDRLVLLSNTFYTEPERGDIIVANKSSFKNGEESIIKRVIALEGDEVDIDFLAGTVSVNGQILEEEYASQTNLQEGMIFPLTVPEGCVFVMGDNRNNSMDSRHPQIGFIDKREILGKAVFLLVPGNNAGKEDAQFNRIGVID